MVKAIIKRIGGRNIKTIIKTVTLTLIFILAVWIRMLPYIEYGPYLSGYDPYFQYRVTQYIVNNGLTSWFTWYDNMSWYPRGRDIPSTSYLGVPLTASITYNLARTLGFEMPLMEFCTLFPAIIGGIIVLIVYLIGREIDGDGAGLISAILLATVPAFLPRTTAGFFDNENVGFLSMTLSILFWVKAMKTGNIIYPILSGAGLAYMNISWGGSIYLLNLYAAYAIIMTILGKYSRKLMINYSLTIGIALIISIQYPYFARKYMLSYATIIPIATMLILTLKDVYKNVEDKRAKCMGIAVVILIGVMGLLFMERMGIISALTGRMMTIVNPFLRASEPLVESVAEHQMPTWSQIFYNYGILIPISAAGLYNMLKRGEENDVLMAIGGITSAYFSSTMARLMMLTAPFIAILSANIVDTIFIQNLKKISEERSYTKRRKTYRRGVKGNIIILLFISAVLIIPVLAWKNQAVSPQQIVTASLPVSNEYQDWIETLLWMRSNLPKNAVVASWWDYGYWITAIANKTTVIDNATMDENQIKKIARAFLSNETEALKIFSELKVTHVVVFEAFDKNTGFLFGGRGWGDFVKSYWMAKIAGLNITDYMTYNSMYGTYLPTGPKASEATLYRLIFNTRSEIWSAWGMNIPKPKNFELIFSSSNGFVFVYKVNYPI